jgi:phosphatidylglycerophosphate synthase
VYTLRAINKKFLWYHYLIFIPDGEGNQIMEGLPYIGRMLVILGIIIILLGFILIVAGNIPWMGRWRGAITIKKDNFIFAFPIVTCIIISLIVTVILYLLRRYPHLNRAF